MFLTQSVGFIAASMCTHDNKHLKVRRCIDVIPAASPPWWSRFRLDDDRACTPLVPSSRWYILHYDEYVGTDGIGMFKGSRRPGYWHSWRCPSRSSS